MEPERKTRILFVDDEAAILHGLRDRLRRERHRWDMVFAEGPVAALEHLCAGSFDIVVTDMRMPGIDGAELLRRIKDLHPQTLRVVLSGHAERDALERAAQVADAFLAKPCDLAHLKAILDEGSRRPVARAPAATGGGA